MERLNFEIFNGRKLLKDEKICIEVKLTLNEWRAFKKEAIRIRLKVIEMDEIEREKLMKKKVKNLIRIY